MKIIFSFRHLILIAFLSSICTSSSLDPLRISTRHFPPYMYQDGNGTFYDGIEFHILQRMARMLKMSLHFQTTSNHSDICFNVAINVSDFCIGVIFPTEDTLKYSVMSITYATDELTWCVPKLGTMPMFLAQMYWLQPNSWFMIIFGYGYSCGFLLYLLIQFDLKFDRRNHCDWHHTTWLVVLPAAIGISPNFQPVKGTVRIFFGFVLISAFFLFQIIWTRAYEFVHKEIPWHQVSSFKEIADKNFHFIGSLEAFNLFSRSEMIPNVEIDSFSICDDISECLVQLSQHNNLAVGGSRQNIFKSPSYSPSKIFCFEGLENIASSPVALYMRKDFHLKEKVNSIVEELFESGFFVKLNRDSKPKRKYEMVGYTIPLPLRIPHISAALVFLIGCGSILSTSSFVAEKLISWKLKQPGRKHRIWIYLEQFFDGERHYLKHLPERLQRRREQNEINFRIWDNAKDNAQKMELNLNECK